jgi:hypothetical protein
VILYRVQAVYPVAEDWATIWAATLAAAKAVAKDFEDSHFVEVTIDKVKIPSGRDGQVDALNHAEVNRINWPGEEIWKSKNSSRS